MPCMLTAGRLPLVHPVPRYHFVRIKTSSAHETHHQAAFVREYALTTHRFTLVPPSVRAEAAFTHRGALAAELKEPLR